MMNNGINNIANSKVVVYPNGMVGVSKEFLNFIRATIGKAYQQMPATNFNQFNGQQMGYDQQSGAYNQQQANYNTGYNQQQGYNYNQPNGQQMGYNQQSGAYNQQQANYNTGYNQQQGYNYNQPNGQQMGYNQQPWAYNQQQANYNTGYNQQQGYNYNQPNGQQMEYNQQPGADNQKPRVNPERKIITPDDVKTITPNRVSLFLKDGILIIPERIEKICSNSLMKEKDIKAIKFESKKIEIENGALASSSNIERIYAETMDICTKIYQSSEFHDRILKGQTHLFLGEKELTLKDLDPELAAHLNFDTATTIDSKNEQVFLDKVEGGVLVIPENIKVVNTSCFSSKRCDIKTVIIKSDTLKLENEFASGGQPFGGYGGAYSNNVEKICAKTMDICMKIYQCLEFHNKILKGETHLFLEEKELTLKDLDPELAAHLNFDTATTIDSRNEQVFLDRVEGGVLVIPENIKVINTSCFSSKRCDIKTVIIKSDTLKLEYGFANGQQPFGGYEGLNEIYAKNIGVLKELLDDNWTLRDILMYEKRLHLFVDGKEITWQELKLKDDQPQIDYKAQYGLRVRTIIEPQDEFIKSETISLDTEQLYLKDMENGVLTIPENISSIFKGCFTDNQEIKKVIIKSKKLGIFGYTDGSKSLSARWAADGPKRDYKVFANCNNLTEICMEDYSVCKEILDKCFTLKRRFVKGDLHLYVGGEEAKVEQIDPELMKIIDPKTAEIIDDDNEYMYLNEGTLTIPENITMIRNRSLIFSNNEEIKKVIINSNRLEISWLMFFNCNNLEEIHIRNFDVWKEVYEHCEKSQLVGKIASGKLSLFIGNTRISLQQLVPKMIGIDPRTITKIDPENEWIYLCNMKDGILTIPENVRSIAQNAFSTNYEIKQIMIESDEPEFEFGGFCGCERIEKIYTKSISVCKAVYKKIRDNTFLFRKFMKGELHLFNEGKEVTLSKIDSEMVKKVNFDTATEIDIYNEFIFLDKMKNGVLVIPENIKKINSDICFSNNASIKKVVIESSELEVNFSQTKEIFNSCDRLKEIHVKSISVIKALITKNHLLIDELNFGWKLHLFVGEQEIPLEALNRIYSSMPM